MTETNENAHNLNRVLQLYRVVVFIQDGHGGQDFNQKNAHFFVQYKSSSIQYSSGSKCTPVGG